MEGIIDGQARDDCFYCTLIYPRRYSDDCPRCGRRMRYQPAALVTSQQLRSELEAQLNRYRHARTDEERRAQLEPLLVWLHRYLPHAQTHLDELVTSGHPNMIRLRRDYQILFEAAQ